MIASIMISVIFGSIGAAAWNTSVWAGERYRAWRTRRQDEANERAFHEFWGALVCQASDGEPRRIDLTHVPDSECGNWEDAS